MSNTTNKIPQRKSTLGILRKLGFFGFLCAILAIVVIAVIGYAKSWRWFVVETPSMGQTAPVGTLVITEPVKVENLSVGDIITFHPSIQQNATYTHRITSFSKEGLTTRGDINGADDPWYVTQPAIVGKSHVFPVWGHVIRALPFLVAGSIFIWIFTTYWVRKRHHIPARILLFTLLVSLLILWLRPFVGFMVINTTQSPEDKHLVVSVVSTGILPTKLAVNESDPHYSTKNGEIVHLDATEHRQDGLYIVNSSLDLDFWGWVIAWMICASPMIWVLLFGVPAYPETLKKPKKESTV